MMAQGRDRRRDAFWQRYYSQLVGATIVGFKMVPDDDEACEMVWPTFTVSKDGETFTVELLSDPEGNGAGFLYGLPDIRAERKPAPHHLGYGNNERGPSL